MLLWCPACVCILLWRHKHIKTSFLPAAVADAPRYVDKALGLALHIEHQICYHWALMYAITRSWRAIVHRDSSRSELKKKVHALFGMRSTSLLFLGQNLLNWRALHNPMLYTAYILRFVYVVWPKSNIRWNTPIFEAKIRIRVYLYVLYVLYGYALKYENTLAQPKV